MFSSCEFLVVRHSPRLIRTEMRDILAHGLSGTWRPWYELLLVVACYDRTCRVLVTMRVTKFWIACNRFILLLPGFVGPYVMTFTWAWSYPTCILFREGLGKLRSWPITILCRDVSVNPATCDMSNGKSLGHNPKRLAYSRSGPRYTPSRKRDLELRPML